ncbi:MAG: tyrosine-type recombinase/integrase [Paracoccaceae bacterium]|nr:tyrosine-type recombinase/integrase [Paracoccaceae bacterium]
MNGKRKLSDNYAKTAEATGKRQVVWDTMQPGFGLRLTASGKHSWIAKYRLGQGRGGIQKLVTLGTPPILSCDDARFKAAQLVTAARQNVDLFQQWQDEAEEAKKVRQTRILASYDVVDLENPAFLKSAWFHHVDLKVGIKKRSREKMKGMWKHIRNNIKENILTKDLTPDHLLKIQKALEETKPEYNKFHSFLSSVLEAEVYAGRIERNIAKRVKKHATKYRDTVLSERGVKQLKEFYSNPENFTKHEQNQARWILCVLLTGSRPSTLASLRKQDDGENNYLDLSDPENPVMVVRDHKMKRYSNLNFITINITQQAAEIMQKAINETPWSPYVFGSMDKRANFSQEQISVKGREELFKKHRDSFEKEGYEPLVTYSLRHTFGTMLVAAGVPLKNVADIMLHNSIVTTQRYVKTTQRSRKDTVKRLESII